MQIRCTVVALIYIFVKSPINWKIALMQILTPSDNLAYNERWCLAKDIFFLLTFAI